jgi:imidazolonepropionase-like amidohydrolase
MRLEIHSDNIFYTKEEKNVKEMELMMDANIPVNVVLEACMIGGLGSGTRADSIALDAEPREDKAALRKVSFVMSDGKVWKQHSIPICFKDALMEDAGHSEPSWQLV